MTRKIVFLYLFLFDFLILFSQEKVDNPSTEIKDTLSAKKISNWEVLGKNSLSLSQNAFSNWVAGGTNSFGVNVKTNYEFNYKKGKHIWNNKVSIAYGQLSNEGEKPKKTDDNVFISSTYGNEISNHWYGSIAMSLQTQIANGYDYNTYPNYTPKDRRSAFMAPGYFTLGVGFEYKPQGKFQLSLYPITSKTTFVLDKKLQKKGNFGLRNDGDSEYLELGAYVGIKYELEIMKNITWKSDLNFFTNYLSHTERIDMNFNTIFDMKVNDYVSAILSFNALYDHDQLKKMQIKQTLGIGFTYAFKNTNKDKS